MYVNYGFYKEYSPNKFMFYTLDILYRYYLGNSYFIQSSMLSGKSTFL